MKHRAIFTSPDGRGHNSCTYVGSVVIYNDLFYTSYSYNSISRYAYRGISAHIPRRDLVIFCVLRSH